MSEVFGTFILSRSGDQFHGEFFNNKMKAFAKEEVQVLETSAFNELIGSFVVQWDEGAGRVAAVLEIDMESDNIYILTWKDVSLNGEPQNVNFTGRGVVRNGLLVAVYSMNHLRMN